MAIEPVGLIPIRSPFSGPGDTGISWPWLRWFQGVAWQLSAPLPGPFATDAAAAAAGVKIHKPYFQPSGAMVVRLT